MLKQITLKKYSTVIIVFVLITINIVGFFLLQNTKNDVDTMQNNLALQNNFIKQNISLTIYQEVNKIDDLFSDEKTVFSLIEYINSNKKQFDNLNLKFSADEPESGEFRYLPLTFEISGKIEKINNFIRDLWTSNYLIEITNLSLEDQASSSAITNLNFTSNLFVRNQFR
jgi:hypothetical protein